MPSRTENDNTIHSCAGSTWKLPTERFRTACLVCHLLFLPLCSPHFSGRLQRSRFLPRVIGDQRPGIESRYADSFFFIYGHTHCNIKQYEVNQRKGVGYNGTLHFSLSQGSDTAKIDVEGWGPCPRVLENATCGAIGKLSAPSCVPPPNRHSSEDWVSAAAAVPSQARIVPPSCASKEAQGGYLRHRSAAAGLVASLQFCRPWFG